MSYVNSNVKETVKPLFRSHFVGKVSCFFFFFLSIAVSLVHHIPIATSSVTALSASLLNAFILCLLGFFPPSPDRLV